MAENVQQHLKKFHDRSLKHHVVKATAHGVAAKVFEKMAEDCGDDDMREHYAKLADQEQAHSDEHVAMGQFHKAAAEACGAPAASKKVDAAGAAVTTAKTVSDDDGTVIPAGLPSEFAHLFGG